MPPSTNSDVSFAKITLSYPIFAAEFDPYNRGYLVVGGGGGSSKTGVPNRISVLDISNRAAIENVLDIDLERDEDSAVSLANLATKDGLVVLAGVNSSEKDQNAGKNEHLRAFDVQYPPRKKQKTESSAVSEKSSYKFLGKRSLFTPATGGKKETYQRLLRLSPAQGRDSSSKRIGAIATGLAQKSEVVVFNATNPTPEQVDVLAKIAVASNEEANDLDIAELEPSEFSLAFCTDYDVHEQTFKYDFGRKRAEKIPNGPRKVWQMPAPDAASKIKSRPKIRCLRFLNPQNVIFLCNKPGQSGAELRIVHFYPTGPGINMAHIDLPKRVKQAALMDVCALDSDKDGNQQFVIAVGSQDLSIEVYTTNYQRHTDTFSPLKKYMTLRNVHEHQMTKLCFTPFHSPGIQPAPTSKVAAPTATRQFIRLASTSYGNTVVVDTFPVTPLDPTDRTSRYVLATDDAWVKWAYILIVSFIVLIFAFLVQSFRGGFAETTDAGVFSILPQGMRDFFDAPAAMAWQRGRTISRIPAGQQEATAVPQIPRNRRLSELLHLHRTSPDSKERTVVIRSEPSNQGSNDDAVHIDEHPNKEQYLEKDPRAKHWHELADYEQARWRERLVRAGEWVESEGESVLTSVLFSEYANVVGGVAQEIIREL